MAAWTEGTKEVLEPTFVLLLAWALGAVITDVGTAEFLASALQAGLPAWSLPALISLLCYAISFACGSSIGEIPTLTLTQSLTLALAQTLTVYAMFFVYV